ncbi:MAG: hypothetical protein HN666_01820, partial [Candidatus Peribacter sp.]|nr:hypothetical protein [Candidatus Peribacter sp.]
MTSLKQYWPLALMLLFVAVIIGKESGMPFLSQLTTGNSCGNFVQESGEECDLGSLNGQNSGCTISCIKECFICEPGMMPCNVQYGADICDLSGYSYTSMEECEI